MGWTPPSKFIVIVTCFTMIFGVIIFMDLNMGLWPTILPVIDLAGYNLWVIIGLILFVLTWLLFFLGVKLSGI